MKTTLKRLIALTTLALLSGPIARTHAIPGNQWKNLGASPGGGYIILGNSTLNLGQLSATSFPVFLSTSGSDIITLNAGSTASASGFVIKLSTSGNTFTNYGSVIGTTNEGVEAYGGGNTLNNWGSITATDYTVDIEGNYNILNNHGTISNSTGGGEPVFLEGQFNIINNWGTISSPYDPFYEETGFHNTLNNMGMIISTGAYGVYSDGSFFTLNNAGTISVAGTGDQAVYADGGNFTLNNTGNIFSVADGVDSLGQNDTLNNWGTISSSSGGNYAIHISGASSTLNNWGTISGNYNAVYFSGASETFNNWGTLSAVDYALFPYGTGNTFNNWGTISSPYYAVYEDGSHITLNNWGMILSSTYGIDSEGDNFTLNNMPTGVITGGAGNEVIFNDGANFVLNNQGSILLNNGGGYAVYSAGNGGVINNSGLISGAGGYGIYLAGSNNIVNLTGHSSVIGTIAATGANNTVNVNFTGMSPAAQAALVNEILAQGGPANFTGTFTVRGVTYVFDPVNIGLQLKSYQLQGITPNQKAIGASLDSVTFNPAPGTPLWTLFNAIDNSGNVPGVLEALSPEKYAIYGSLAIENSTAMVQNIDARLNNLRDGSESVDTTGIGGGITSGAIVTGDPSKDGGKETKGVVQPAPEKNRWGFFATGDGLFLRGATRSLGGETGKADSAGTLIGVDGKVGEHAVIGTFFSYNNSAAILGADGSHATVQSYSGGLYGTWHQDGFYVNSLAAYTRNNYDSQRNILIPGFGSNAAGSTDGNQATVNLDGGYDWHVSDRLTAGPIAGMQYVHLDVDGFNETGSLASLGIGSQSMDSLQSRLGARLDYHIATTSTSSFAAEFYAAWQHEYLNDSRSINASFQGGGLAPFSVQTGSPQRDAAVVGASLNFSFHNRLTLFAGYELQLWQSSSFEQSINGGARISF